MDFRIASTFVYVLFFIFIINEHFQLVYFIFFFRFLNRLKKLSNAEEPRQYNYHKQTSLIFSRCYFPPLYQ